MKIFISWSGELSRKAAVLFRSWIGDVLQASVPWMSSRDLDKGTAWFQEIAEQLKDTDTGVIFLTKENKEKPWLHYEAGALAKGLSTNRVMTVLVDLEPSEVGDPLAQINHTRTSRDDMKKLVEDLNRRLAVPLENLRLGNVFDTYWRKFEKGLSDILSGHISPKPENTPDNLSEKLLREIFDTARRIETGMVTHRNDARELPTSPGLLGMLRGTLINFLEQNHLSWKDLDKEIAHGVVWEIHGAAFANAPTTDRAIEVLLEKEKFMEEIEEESAEAEHDGDVGDGDEWSVGEEHEPNEKQ